MTQKMTTKKLAMAGVLTALATVGSMISFPVAGTIMVEPTESESKASLDQFVGMLRHLAEKAKSGDVAAFKASPRLAPRRRVDETLAARQPKLVHQG